MPPTLRYWPETAQHLILAFDRPGYGLSDYDNQFSFDSVCNDVAELVEHLHIEKFGTKKFEFRGIFRKIFFPAYTFRSNCWFDLVFHVALAHNCRRPP